MKIKPYQNEREKIPLPFYSAVHYWLKKKYGVATKCEGKKCKKISTSYQWAKKPGKQYDFKRANFRQLCRSCHSIQDMPERTRNWISETNRNKLKTHCIRGHEFTPENTGHKTWKNRQHRFCRLCIEVYRTSGLKAMHAKRFKARHPERAKKWRRDWTRRKFNIPPEKWRV